MQHIETVPVGSGGAASITFSAIPADYTDLYLVCSFRSSLATSNTSVLVRPNGATTGLSTRILQGDGSSASSFAPTTIPFLMPAATNTANTFGVASVYIPNYLSSVAKSFSIEDVTENNGTTAGQRITAGLWTGTVAITSIDLVPESGGNFVEFSSASLYGITAGSDGIVAVS